MGEVFVGSRLDEHLYEICERIGPRWAGTPGDEAAARYIKDRFEEYGLSAPPLTGFIPRNSKRCHHSYPVGDLEGLLTCATPDRISHLTSVLRPIPCQVPEPQVMAAQPRDWTNQPGGRWSTPNRTPRRYRSLREPLR